MGDFKCHRVNFYNFKANAIHALAFDNTFKKLAVGRSNGCIEVWDTRHSSWFQERVLPPHSNHTIETLVWCRGRLFSAGLDGFLFEHDLNSIYHKVSQSSNSGAIWCSCTDLENTILVGTEDGSVVRFNLQRNEFQFDGFVTRQTSRILSLSWIPKTNLAVVGGIDVLYVIDVFRSQVIHRMIPARENKSKETIIWSVTAFSDQTIVSADSAGRISFWNGETGTYVQSFRSHKADVLSVITTKKNQVFSAGVDGQIVQFDFIDSKWHQSTPQNRSMYHTHDIRALCSIGYDIASGGIDCNLVHCQVGTRKITVYPPIPPRNLISFSEDHGLLLLQYESYLELWRLGEADQMLSLIRKPEKLIKLNARGKEFVVCSDISKSGTILAYSDTKHTRLFTLEDSGCKLTKVKLNKALDASWKILVLKYTVICCQSHGKVLLIDVRDDCQVLTIKESGEAVSILSCSEDEKFFALGDHGSNIEVYDVKSKEFVYNLPQYSSAQPTALAFHPQLPLLITSYSDEKIYEFDSEKGQYSQRNVTLNDIWRSRRSLSDAVLNIQYEKNDKIIIQTHSTISIIDSSGTEKNNLHECRRFKYILFGKSFNGEMVIVEQRPDRIAKSFPAAMRKKEFGT